MCFGLGGVYIVRRHYSSELSNSKHRQTAHKPNGTIWIHRTHHPHPHRHHNHTTTNVCESTCAMRFPSNQTITISRQSLSNGYPVLSVRVIQSQELMWFFFACASFQLLVRWCAFLILNHILLGHAFHFPHIFYAPHIIQQPTKIRRKDIKVDRKIEFVYIVRGAPFDRTRCGYASFGCAPDCRLRIANIYSQSAERPKIFEGQFKC